MSETKMVKVRNRNGSVVGYQIPEAGINRQFSINETKTIPESELQQLQYVPGGDYILKHALVIEDEEVLTDLNMKVEPEYSYTEEDIKNILFNGTLDELEDFLNFSPDGGIEILKKMAVELEVPDTRKRKLISEKTGFNINTAIGINEMLDQETEEEETEEKVRKAAAPTRKAETSSTPERKAAPKYKVTKMG